MNNNTLYVVGIGPGDLDLLSPLSREVIEHADVVCGYEKYIELIREILRDEQLVYATGMTKEVERVRKAIEFYHKGKTVAIVCSGDPSLYALAALVYEIADGDVNIYVVPGITAALAASARLGSPITDDLLILSMSDLLTGWEIIKKRIEAAIMGDLVCAVYNPKSAKRTEQIGYLVSRFYEKRGRLLCGAVKNVYRKSEEKRVWELPFIDYDFIDMSTILIIGNSKTYLKGGKMITPRGYNISNMEGDKS